MKKRSFIVALAAAVLCMGLVGCSGGLTANDATVYVQGLLDKTYLGKYNEDYMELVDVDQSTLEQDYEDGLQVEAEVFCNYFEIVDPSDELMEEIIDFYREAYSHSKYTVNPASKMSTGGYAVEVVISPLDVISLMNEAAEEMSDGFFAQYDDVDVNAMSDEEYETFMADFEVKWGEAIVDLAYEKLPECGYLEDTYLTVQVKQGDDGMWSLLDSDFEAIDLAMIAY